MSNLKSSARKILPRSVISIYDGLRQELLSRRNRRMTTEEVFTDIYSNNRWGGRVGTFCSGDGSRETAIVSPYISCISSEFARIGAGSMTAVDLGCGDYSVGSQLSPLCGRYIGVDIVKPLVEHNQATFGSPRVSFRHANIIEDELPQGDICFVRQVMQHLSNEQIGALLPKLETFRRCFVTEHHPSAGKLRQPNQNKSQGDSIRVSCGSGVFLDAPPFNVPTDKYRLILEVPGVEPIDGGDPGVVRTYMMG